MGRVAITLTPNSAKSVKNVGHGAAHRYWTVDPLNYDRLLPPGWLGEILAFKYLGNHEDTTKAFPQMLQIAVSKRMGGQTLCKEVLGSTFRQNPCPDRQTESTVRTTKAKISDNSSRMGISISYG
ncbi:hypothetical protein BST61_g11286 [Cercospora zeina]